jgi:flagellar basal-body rod protein FlgF
LNRGLYIGATSLLANEKRMEVLSNNLANINTTAYKKDISLVESFAERLLSKINGTSLNTTLGNQSNITYQVNGQTYIARTDNGYFTISTPEGNSYVKEVRFTIDEDGFLRTYYRDGRDDLNTDNENYILDGNGNPLQAQGGDIQGLLETSIYYPSAYVIGTMSAGVNFKKVVTDFTQGELIETGGTYDLALNQSGFFKVMDEDGNTYYTRDGSFVVAENQLVTANGEIVQGLNGPIYINGNTVSILENGQVLVDGNIAGTLDVVDLENREFLRKIGDNLYSMAEGVEPEEVPYEGKVLQGYLEGSNVNAIDEMVEMISLLREFETSQKLIRMQDEMLEKAVNEIGRI